jgi:protein-disulfide isomerase
MMRKAIFLLLGVTALLTLKLASPFPAQGGPLKTDDFVLGGDLSAPVRMEVYSDYQCPTCRDFYLGTLLPIAKEYGRENKLCVIYHDFPLKSHKYAFEASRYALAARRLGREQWLRVSEALYADQPKWAVDGRPEAAAARVLTPEDLARVKKFLEDPAIEQFLNREIEAARQRKVSSTPTFFLMVGGREQKIAQRVSYPIMKDYLDRLLKGSK